MTTSPMTFDEIQTAAAALPEFSRRVFYSLVRGLYAEPGFSDVEATDIANDLAVPVNRVKGALSRLSVVGLLSDAEPTEVNDEILYLLYSPFWSNSNIDDKDADAGMTYREWENLRSFAADYKENPTIITIPTGPPPTKKTTDRAPAREEKTDAERADGFEYTVSVKIDIDTDVIYHAMMNHYAAMDPRDADREPNAKGKWAMIAATRDELRIFGLTVVEMSENAEQELGPGFCAALLDHIEAVFGREVA